MSISSATRKAGPYSCNGATVAFPFSFKVFAAGDVRVVLTEAAGIESDLTIAMNYSVAINADQDANPGGTVTTVATYATGYLITLTSQVQNLQPVTLTNQGGFYPKVINDALDRLTILVQQVAEQVGRAVKVGISSATSPDQLIATLLTAVANALTYSGNASSSATAAANSAASAAASAAAAIATPVAAPIHAAPSAALVDADEMGFWDSVSLGLSKVTWANVKATLKTYLDTLYAAKGSNTDITSLTPSSPGTINNMAIGGGTPLAGAFTTLTANGGIQSTSPSALIGYGTGSGGMVTQTTSKSTAVTLNKPGGQIVMNNAALASGVAVTFQLNNSLISPSDMVDVVVSDSVATAGSYEVWSSDARAGNCQITLRNISAGSLSNAVVLQFGVRKGVTV
ncbi:hypothetical protein SKTS_19460 [Sulfurimicrobium lacus]|uniref:Tail fiber protein n=1 Tax=Sulfurimicrobium lacus TaxID=2715678 RepID=A0A6F8VCK1_9PROT|nr:hypothetical protein [Sulfurimicrobium lacus]BCB27060.1 hypothetical protein SKTS_19460 [Sulfurimicrobium lacus]